MNKTILTIFFFVAFIQMVFSGGIVTNTNQSAAWVRSMVRDASVDVDAVFFNPAGLVHLEDGFYIQVNSQTVMQSRTVTSSFPTLNNGTYEGSTFVPALPTGFAVYKKGKFAVSAGFTVIGGGGSAAFDRGLPEFEQDISTLVPSMNDLADALNPDLAVTGYSADINFEGSSAYYAVQAGVSYRINDFISAGIGARYIMANNSYTGHLKDISLIMASGPVLATDYINNMALPTVNGAIAQIDDGLTQLNTAITTITPYSELVDNFITGIPGSENYNVNEALGVAILLGQIDEAQAENIKTFLQTFGYDPSQITLGELNTELNSQLVILNGQYETYSGQKAELTGTAQTLAATSSLVGDQEVNVTQSGSGFTPIVSLDINMLDGDLGLALKYEHKTAMKVVTTVDVDDTGTYIDGEEVTADMPAMISVGLRYKPIDKLKLQTGFHYYMDNNASYGRKADDPTAGFRQGEFVNNGEEVSIDGVTQSYLAGNSYEAALGLEYDINKMFAASAGFLYAASNPNSVFQSGLSYTLNTMTFGVGLKLHLMERFDLDLAYSNTTYDEYTKELNHAVFGDYTELYDKTASVFAAGLTYRF